MNRKHVLIIDGMALLFRSFFATSFTGQFMRNQAGVPTNAIYGFLKHLTLANKQFSPDTILCCWDLGGKTFRHEIFPQYKANRDEPPLELLPQFQLIKHIVQALGIENISHPGYEADDCIGTLSTRLSQDHKINILTGDQDLLQLINQNTYVTLLKKGYGNYQVYNLDLLELEWGITPKQLIDLKALMGDSADNYPGVKGIGKKTAGRLLKDYSSIERIIENIEELPRGVQTKIKNDLEMLHLSRKLATIFCHVPLVFDSSLAPWEPKYDVISRSFRDLGCSHLTSLVR
ncbi:5'-3' exonuclease [Terrilactibacillus sp. BCM23-1]|uniref:5'-3' exonuclease n=1 Tax=Terrilactibacillus tamarindi TaxID=2599694 RepID=A0A6N8CRZ1_9BACI|nr:5'-3' exonuclease [Terrilactibacillus tamarindi]MTT31967.1 5'-3' exonuclease [Terrilactibacillus tamarindi]